MSNVFYCGIDPGRSGAIAFLDKNGEVEGYSIFNEKEYCRLLSYYREQGVVYAMVEDVHAMPKQGVSSMFSFGHNKGFIEGILFALNIPYKLISPMKWKKYFNLCVPRGTEKKDAKNLSIELAEEFYPNIDFRASHRCKKPHDGICEAVLMAKYLYSNDRVSIPYQ